MNITFEYNNKPYCLEYSKQAVRTMENQGFSIEQIGEKPTTMIPMLFQGAFIKNHQGIKRKLVDEIYNSLDKDQLVVSLAEMYTDTVNSVLEGEAVDEAKKISWTKNE